MRLEDAIKDYLSFLRRPSYNREWTEKLDWLTITKLFFVVFALEMLLLIPLSSFIGMEDIPHAFESLMTDHSIWMIAGLAIVIAPILEELIFRLHLKYLWLSVLFLVVLGFVGLFLVMKIAAPDFSSQIADQLAYIPQNKFLMVVSFVLLIVIMAIIYMISKTLPRSLMNTVFPFLFYLTALVFALVHIGNFDVSNVKWYLTPLLVLPQFVLALYLGYVRVRNHIGSSMSVHALNNSIPMLLLVLAGGGQ